MTKPPPTTDHDRPTNYYGKMAEEISARLLFFIFLCIFTYVRRIFDDKKHDDDAPLYAVIILFISAFLIYVIFTESIPGGFGAILAWIGVFIATQWKSTSAEVIGEHRRIQEDAHRQQEQQRQEDARKARARGEEARRQEWQRQQQEEARRQSEREAQARRAARARQEEEARRRAEQARQQQQRQQQEEAHRRQQEDHARRQREEQKRRQHDENAYQQRSSGRSGAQDARDEEFSIKNVDHLLRPVDAENAQKWFDLYAKWSKTKPSPGDRTLYLTATRAIYDRYLYEKGAYSDLLDKAQGPSKSAG